MTADRSPAARLLARYAGLARGHGNATPKEAIPNVKREAFYQTVREPALVDHWERHLQGTYGLGIVPIRDDATVVFGAIDIDKYDGIDHSGLAGKIQQLELPLVVCRSKSGGAHLYAFGAEAVTAELMRTRLMEWAVALGASGCEIFPKQIRLASLNDYGSWINMPYFGSLSVEGTDRFAVGVKGPMQLEQFLDYADVIAVTQSELRGIVVKQDPQLQELWLEAPPCLQTIMAQGGFGEGERNTGMFSVGVYLKKRFGGDALQEKLDVYNQHCSDTPMATKEVHAIAKNHAKKDYGYKCQELPIQRCCNRQICLTRRFGIKREDDENESGVVFGSMVKIESDPVLWIWDVNGARIECTSSELKDQGKFATKCMDKLNLWPWAMKPKPWHDLISEKMRTAEVQSVPIETTSEGEIWYFFQAFASARSTARDRDMVEKGYVWLQDGELLFSGVAFHKYLKSQGIVVDIRKVWKTLHLHHKADNRTWKVKGKQLHYWAIPDFGVASLQLEEEPV